jgi:hypothetical protein
MWFEFGIGQHLQRLLPVQSDTERQRTSRLRKDLLDQEDIAGVILDQKDLFHEKIRLVRRRLSHLCSQNFMLGDPRCLHRTPVSTPVSARCAPRITAPVGSSTVPVTVPRLVCALAAPASAKTPQRNPVSRVPPKN